MSNIVDHSIFLDFTCSIVRSKIYSNYLFIYFCKKRKKKRVHKQALQIAMPLTFTTSHLPCSSLFIVKHFSPISIFIYQKKNTFLKKIPKKKKNWKFIWHPKSLIVKLKQFLNLTHIKQNKESNKTNQNYLYVYIYIYLLY